ncbi:hypothetical protein HMPREF9554_01279, partial [Treponema phagedenis F0421]
TRTSKPNRRVGLFLKNSICTHCTNFKNLVRPYYHFRALILS